MLVHRPCAPAQDRRRRAGRPAGHADHQLLRRPQLGHALADLADTPRVPLSAPIDAVPVSTGVPSRFSAQIWVKRRDPPTGLAREGPHLLALDHHVLVMRADAAGLEPVCAEKLVQQWIELAEMRRPFDGPGTQAEPGGHRVVVDRACGRRRPDRPASGAACAAARKERARRQRAWTFEEQSKFDGLTGVHREVYECPPRSRGGSASRKTSKVFHAGTGGV